MVTPVMSWRRGLKSSILPIACFIAGMIVAGLAVTICYIRQGNDDYGKQTSIHEALYKQASCNAALCHRERRGKR